MFSTDPVVTIKEASIFQDHNTVLGDVSFDIQKGEFVYLVGRTGSGKSSLLKTLYADLPLRQGDITVAGFTVTGMIDRTKWGMTFGAPAIGAKIPIQIDLEMSPRNLP